MKHIKMMIYGEPGVGKSVFASKAPKPFFITTDGNYEWLEDFGAKPEAHKQVFSWEEAKQAFTEDYNDYDTIVVDLVEDLFKWCEQEYCIRTKIDHISDVGYGKGYDITRNEFFLEISKLLGKPKNVILISHGITFSTKDRRGVEHFRHAPSSRIPDKVMDMIEGRLRYCLRCYLKAEETDDGTLIKKRYLSLIPKENEFGICRGIDESKVPHDIPLDWNDFAKAINYDNSQVNETSTEPEQIVETTNIESVQAKEEAKKEAKKEIKEETKAETVEVTTPLVDTKVEEQPKVEETKPVEQPKEMSNADKIAAIKAKLAAMKGNN